MLAFQEQYPGDDRVPRAQYLVGLYQHKRNYLNTALKEYDYVLKDFPRTIYAAHARHRIADIHIHMEQFEKAAETLDTLAEKFKGSVEAFHALRRLGDLYLRMNNEQKAVETFQRLIDYNVLQLLQDSPRAEHKQIDQDIHRGVMFLANRAIKNENYAAARAAYQRLPDMWEKVRLMIDLLYRQEKFGEIHDLVNQMKDQNYWKAQGILLAYFLKRGSTQGIKNVVRNVTEEHEKSKKLTGLLAQLKDGMEEFSDSDKRSVYELVATRYRPLRRDFEYLVCDLVKEEDPKVLQRFIITYQDGEDVEQVKRWRGIYFERAGERRRAEEQYKEMKEEAQGHLYIAETYHGEYAREGGNVDLEKAVQEYLQIRRRFYDTETTCTAYWRTAQIQVKMGQKKEAIETLEELEQRFMGQPDWQVRARMQIADWHRAWGRHEEAIRSYRQVDRRYPDTQQQRLALYRIGLCHEELKEKDKAIQAFLECIRRFDKTRIQSRAHTRLEVKYEIPDLMIRDMAAEQE
jgi:TolA-binding protein